MDSNLTSGSKFFLEQMNTLQEVLIQNKGSKVKKIERRKEETGLFS